ncbi:phenylacetate--CoA ligase family protein [bacterium]|nr:phenylacetate--CoA ligase family protein [candidate division CSSED10-310 bacterium]
MKRFIRSKILNFKIQRRIYEGMPQPLRNMIACVPFHIVAGKHYREVMRRQAYFDRAGRDDIHAYQEERLKNILNFAVDHVTAYKPYARSVRRYNAFDALREFPPLEKEHLQKNLNAYLPDILKEIPHYECTTGGTSGNQLKFYVDNHSQSVETAFMHRQWKRVGYAPNCKKATFRGVDFSDLSSGVYWQSNPIYNELQFSPYHMSDSTMNAYWNKLCQYNPAFIHGYPSAISLLARFLNSNHYDVSVLNIRAVLLGSENLFPDQRTLIESVFKTRVFSWYGHSERLILAGECEETTDYHHFPDYGILEFLDDADQPVDTPGDYGELTGTGLLNYSLPLIRYKTGDRARLLDWNCKCGRAFDRFDNVQGRWHQEIVIGKHGAKISLAALNVHGDFFDHVVRYQYHQKKPGLLTIKMMVDDIYSSEDDFSIKQAYKRKLGDVLDISLEIVPDIPLTSRGKFRKLVQEIPDAGL